IDRGRRRAPRARPSGLERPRPSRCRLRDGRGRRTTGAPPGALRLGTRGARRAREVPFATEPPAGAIPSADDTLRLYFLCAHPDLSSSSAVALTLRAVGGLTTRQIAQAYLVPESTMAQRISRAKRTVSEAGVDRPGDVGTVM